MLRESNSLINLRCVQLFISAPFQHFSWGCVGKEGEDGDIRVNGNEMWGENLGKL